MGRLLSQTAVGIVGGLALGVGATPALAHEGPVRSSNAMPARAAAAGMRAASFGFGRYVGGFNRGWGFGHGNGWGFGRGWHDNPWDHGHGHGGGPWGDGHGHGHGGNPWGGGGHPCSPG